MEKSKMERKEVVCPVCNKSFPEKLINDHANQCLNASNGDDASCTSKKRKSNECGWGFLMDKNSKRSKVAEAGSKRLDTNREVIDLCVNDYDERDTDIKTTEIKNQCLESASKSRKPHTQTLTQGTEVYGEDRHCDSFSVPLAEQMRPGSFENYVGQQKAIGDDKMLMKLLKSDTVPSMIFWGPPGCGKTTLAKIIAKRCKEKSKFVQLSATSSGVNDVKEVVKNAKNTLHMFRKRTILFLDEIHRFNKLQQDSLLPHVEDGTITLIGATTENPSFQVNNALLSRCRVIVLEKLDKEAVRQILDRAVQKLGFEVVRDEEETVKDSSRVIEQSALDFLSIICDGDARIALNGLQITVQSHLSKGIASEDDMMCKSGVRIRTEDVKAGLQRSHVSYDRTGEEHYNMISALHKSMRGGDDSAALYWMARMMEGGEDPLFIARRLIEFASCDIGLADPQALTLAVSTFQAVHFIGKPECEKPLAQCVVYLSRAPKSMEVTAAYGKAKSCVLDHSGPLPSVPLHLRNAPTKLMKSLGYGKGYNTSRKMDFFPDCLTGTNFFE